MKGWFGKILVVDLANRTFSEEKVPDAVYRKYIGGKGLAAHLLLKKNRPGVDPLSPENHLIFGMGPITDTLIWGSSRYGVFTKSPQTGFFSESYSGGRVAEPMSRTGYDAIVLSGAAAGLTWLEISDRGVTFHDAARLRGMEVYETQDAVTAALGRKEAGVLVIGPAAENGVRFSMIANNYWRCAGRSGAGAVMGAKNVKAVCFYGDRKRDVADPEAMKAFVKEWAKKAKNNPVVKFFKTLGTPGMVKTINLAGAFPTRYWSEGTLDGWEAISADTLNKDFSVVPNACSRCFMACGRLTTVKEGKRKGLTVEGPEYETIFAFGGLCVIKKLDDIIYLNDICDRLGIDTITAGNLSAFTIEAGRRGRIEERLDYGDTEGIAGLLHKIAGREGIGAVLAEGIRHAAKVWDLEDIAIHVKGMEPAAYDPRVLKSMALSYATSDRGACHARTTAFKAELAGIIDPDQIEGKAKVVVDFEDRLTFMDALIGCRFFRDFYLWDEFAKIVGMTTGISLSTDDLRRIASDIRNATRFFNIREGMLPEDDTLPRRFFEEGIGPEKKVIRREDFEKMKSDYYRLRGWNTQGVPVETLKDLG